MNINKTKSNDKNIFEMSNHELKQNILRYTVEKEKINKNIDSKLFNQFWAI